MHPMDRRTFLRTGLGAAGGMALAACSKSKKPGAQVSAGGAQSLTKPVPRPTLKMSVALDFGLPSPFSYTGGPGYALMILMYDTLLQEDADGRMLPLLAREFRKSDDGRTWTFTMRNDVKWHDGRPLTAEDVVFTYQYYASQTLSPQLVARPQDVADVRSTAPDTVEIRLDKPAVTFPRAVAGQLPIVPRHIWSSISDATGASDQKLLVGSGPYRLESYTPGEGTYLFTANDGYFLGRPFVKRIEQRPVGDDLQALMAGEIDVGQTDVFGVPSDVLAPFRDNGTFGIQEFKTAIAIPMRWNLSKGGALADARFRQACAHAIDRNGIVQRLTRGNAVAGNPGYLPPTNGYYVPVEQYPYDPAAANRMLDDAGLRRSAPNAVRQGRDGKPLRYTLTVVSGIPAVLELVVGALRNVGVEVTPKSVPLIQLLGAADYEMAVAFDGDITAGSDPDHLRLVYSSRSGTFQHPPGYANPKVDDLAERQVVTQDDGERRRLLADLQRLVAQDVPALPLYYPTEYSIFRRKAFDQWSEGNALTETKRNVVTGLKSGLTIRPTAAG
jgi:peptide/nickel transport system substrate-binding protein